MPPVTKHYIGCPVQHALSFIGGKWQIGILWNLRKKPLRFGELRERLPGLSEKVLAANLRFFESERMIRRQVFAVVPSRVEYRLTSDGQQLVPVLERIVKWGYLHLQDQPVSKSMFSTPRAAVAEIQSV